MLQGMGPGDVCRAAAEAGRKEQGFRSPWSPFPAQRSHTLGI